MGTLRVGSQTTGDRAFLLLIRSASIPHPKLHEFANPLVVPSTIAGDHSHGEPIVVEGGLTAGV